MRTFTNLANLSSRLTAAVACAASLGLVACGGGDYASGTTSPPPAPAPVTAVPDGAVASSTSLVGFLGALASDDTKEPLTLPAAEAAVSETDEPVAI